MGAKSFFTQYIEYIHICMYIYINLYQPVLIKVEKKLYKLKAKMKSESKENETLVNSTEGQ